MTTLKTQNAQVADYLAKGGAITPLDAMRMFGIERLASRVYDCKKLGMSIDRQMVAVEGRQGRARVARYSLAKEPAHA